jgi:hypothetical protein
MTQQKVWTSAKFRNAENLVKLWVRVTLLSVKYSTVSRFSREKTTWIITFVDYRLALHASRSYSYFLKNFMYELLFIEPLLKHPTKN